MLCEVWKPVPRPLKLRRVIEKLDKDLAYILYRLEGSDLVSLPETVQQLKQEELITQEVAEKLLEKPYTFPQMIGVMKDIKTGSCVTQYLPSSTEEMMEKTIIVLR